MVTFTKNPAFFPSPMMFFFRCSLATLSNYDVVQIFSSLVDLLTNFVAAFFKCGGILEPEKVNNLQLNMTEVQTLGKFFARCNGRTNYVEFIMFEPRCPPILCAKYRNTLQRSTAAFKTFRYGSTAKVFLSSPASVVECLSKFDKVVTNVTQETMGSGHYNFSEHGKSKPNSLYI